MVERGSLVSLCYLILVGHVVYERTINENMVGVIA